MAPRLARASAALLATLMVAEGSIRLSPTMAVGADTGEACGLMTGCAELKCRPPFELKRSPGQCCPTCAASDEVVALDRHTAMKGPSPYAVKPAAGAPVTCKGVKCFTLMCRSGFEPAQKP